MFLARHQAPEPVTAVSFPGGGTHARLSHVWAVLRASLRPLRVLAAQHVGTGQLVARLQPRGTCPCAGVSLGACGWGSGSVPHPSCPSRNHVVWFVSFSFSRSGGRLFYFSESLEWPVCGGPLGLFSYSQIRLLKLTSLTVTHTRSHVTSGTT